MPSIEAKYERLLQVIGENIKSYRKKSGLSQSDMTEHGFELRNYQRIESGAHSPSLFTLHKLAEVFNCNLEDLFKLPK